MGSTTDESSLSTVTENPVLFLNIVLQDVRQAVKDGVAEKLAEKNLPPKLRESLAKRLGNLAADKMTASKVVEKMAPKMCADLPRKMKDKGLAVVVKEVFREGPYFVLMMQVQHVDSSVLGLAEQEAKEQQKQQKGEGWAAKALINGMNFFGITEAVETGYLPRFVQSKLQTEMGSTMEAELAEKRLQASVDVLPEDKQARFFYALLEEIRDEEQRKVEDKKGPVGFLFKSSTSK